MQKVYIGATQMMGKGILWTLLDGHPKLHINLVHVSIGTFLLANDFKKEMIGRNISALKTAEDRYLNTLLITYPDKSQLRLNIGDFFFMMYKYGHYKGLYCSAKNDVTMINNKEQNSEFSKFYFDINLYEKLIEKEFFNKNETKLHLNKVITILQQNYYKCRKHNKKQKPKIFIESLAPGYQPIIDVLKEIKDAKFLCLKRDPIALCYANMSRNVKNEKGNTKPFIKRFFFSILEKTNLKELFMLSNQGEFYRKKVLLYNDNIIKKNKHNKRILFVDFNDLILKTNETMKKISEFLGIKYSKILLIPSIDGKLISKKQSIVNVINDDHLSIFSKKQIDIAQNIYSKITNKSLFIYKIFLSLTFFILILKYILFKK